MKALIVNANVLKNVVIKNEKRTGLHYSTHLFYILLKFRSKSSTPNERIYAPANVACELDGGNINMAQLDKKTVDWLHEKINDQVSAPTIFSRRSNLLCINLYFLIKSLKRGRTCTRGRSARKTKMLESN